MKQKAFILGKDGEEDGRQDALGVNVESGLFAVADGVSNSFHPEVVARSLCKMFTEISPDVLNDWESYSQTSFLPCVRTTWEEYVHNYLGTLSGRILRHEMLNLETWKYGASTFCGICIDSSKHVLKYVITGDSTLFVVCRDGTMKSFSSNPKIIAPDGKEWTDYSDSATNAISSDGMNFGEWLVGELSLADVDTVALMTDGMAKWFQNEMIADRHPEQVLWALPDADSFRILAGQTRAKGEMDDDLAVILINPNAGTNETPIIATTEILSANDSNEQTGNIVEDTTAELQNICLPTEDMPVFVDSAEQQPEQIPEAGWQEEDICDEDAEPKEETLPEEMVENKEHVSCIDRLNVVIDTFVGKTKETIDAIKKIWLNNRTE